MTPSDTTTNYQVANVSTEQDVQIDEENKTVSLIDTVYVTLQQFSESLAL